MKRGRIFSIGYQQRPIADFLALLAEHRVDIVVDVRETPWSHRREYSKTALAQRLQDIGVQYYHAKFAGNPKEIRRAAATHDACLDGFASYLSKNANVVEEFDAEVGAMIRRGQSVCLLCYERHPNDCHRTIVIDTWVEAAAEKPPVKHLGVSGAKRLTER
jgi:uncharacterized protein (DUF488 family)